jgi:hypothetical protein
VPLTANRFVVSNTTDIFDLLVDDDFDENLVIDDHDIKIPVSVSAQPNSTQRILECNEAEVKIPISTTSRPHYTARNIAESQISFR